MKSIRTLLATAAVLAAATAFAQDNRPSARPEAPAMPTPGPEHGVLKDLAGSWDATVESFAGPNQPPMLAKGIDTGTMVGGFWLVSDFKSEVMGQPFLGRSTLGFDPAKK